MKIITLILSVLLLANCNQYNKRDYEISWATADLRKVKSEVRRIAQEQNPYNEDDESNIKNYYRESRNIRKEIRALKKQMKESCLSKNSNSNTELKIINLGSSISIPRQGLEYDNDCVAKTNTNSALLKLQEKKEEIEAKQASHKQYTKNIDKLVEQYTNDLITNYSLDKYELIVAEKKSNILYNKKGLSLNITTALINSIEKEKLIIKQTTSKRD